MGKWAVAILATSVAACGGGPTAGDGGIDASTDAQAARRDAVILRLDSATSAADAGPPACGSDAQCGSGFCERPPGRCEATGVCVSLPESCDDARAPVCGCDGTTYDNDCERQRARVGRSYEGVCSPIGDVMCDEGRRCPSGEFCEAAQCGGAGFCRAVPEATDCPDLPGRVCGCDGVTYDNDCQRRAAGVRADHLGACAVNECELDARFGCCFDDGDCIASRCRGASCTEEGEGRCHVDPIFGECWADGDCDAGERCDGARLCPCGDLCIVPDAPGECVPAG